MRTSISLSLHHAETASVLWISLILAGILGLTLGTCLYMVRTQNVLVAESQAWNATLALAEGGIEEGLAQINIAAGNFSSTSSATNFTPSASTNWGGSGAQYGPVSR